MASFMLVTVAVLKELKQTHRHRDRILFCIVYLCLLLESNLTGKISGCSMLFLVLCLSLRDFPPPGIIFCLAFHFKGKHILHLLIHAIHFPQQS